MLGIDARACEGFPIQVSVTEPVAPLIPHCSIPPATG